MGKVEPRTADDPKVAAKVARLVGAVEKDLGEVSADQRVLLDLLGQNLVLLARLEQAMSHCSPPLLVKVGRVAVALANSIRFTLSGLRQGVRRPPRRPIVTPEDIWAEAARLREEAEAQASGKGEAETEDQG